MIYKILLSIFLTIFIAACSTKPKDAADSSGSGATSSASADTSSSDVSIEPGSQEDLIVNVGDRVFFDYNSSELDEDA